MTRISRPTSLPAINAFSKGLAVPARMGGAGPQRKAVFGRDGTRQAAPDAAPQAFSTPSGDNENSADGASSIARQAARGSRSRPRPVDPADYTLR